MILKEYDFERKGEYELLTYCSQTTINAEIEEKIRNLAEKDIDWKYLIETAHQHKLIPLLYFNLNSICPEKVPPKISYILSYQFKNNSNHNIRLNDELFKILNLLKSHNIIAIPYKGPVLAVTTYGNLALREFSDLDILINKSDALKVAKILLSSEYKLMSHLDDIEKALNFYLKTQREFKFFKENLDFIIEIQWDLNEPLSLLNKSNFILKKERLEVLNINKTKINIFSPEDLFIILCIHAAAHDWINLSGICDICELIKSNELHWKEIFENADKIQIKRIILITLCLANDLYDLKLPDEISQLLADNSVRKISNKIEKRWFCEDITFNFLDKTLLDFRKRENKMRGTKDCIKTLFKPSDKEFNALYLPMYLFPLYYFIRPFLLINRYRIGEVG